jgi:AcrR family transcriptional regulator
MKSPKSKLVVDPSTEEKIKNAARIIFHQKGYAGTKTRDIAEEAGINLALLNYYFRSKEKLFGIIMVESLQSFRLSMMDVINNEKTSLENKIETIVNNYINLLIDEPDIPLFILSELRSNPAVLISKIDPKKTLLNSYFSKQYQLKVQEGKIVQTDPIHFIMNLVGMIVFPFIASPLLKNIGGLTQDQFNELMTQRKILIPKWIKMILKAK